MAGGIPPSKKWNWWEQESHEMFLQKQVTVTNTEHSCNSLPMTAVNQLPLMEVQGCEMLFVKEICLYQLRMRA